MARIRSPNYPALSLPDAIARVRDVHNAQQTTPEPRDVVIKHMGYSGVNGRSLKSLSALIKYGLLEAAGDDGLRVSKRALAIIFPDPEDAESTDRSLLAAAQSPALFASIFERWQSRPTEESLKAFLVRKGFNSNSFDHVARAFYETFDLVSPLFGLYDSRGQASSEDGEGEGDKDDKDDAMNSAREHQEKPVSGSQTASKQGINSTRPVFDFETVEINTRIDNQEDLAELLLRLEKIKSLLPSKNQH